MTTESIVLYFGSAAAQVWAALVAFVGIAIRDQIEKRERSKERHFLELVDQVRPIASLFERSSGDPVFMDPQRFIAWLDQEGDWSSRVAAMSGKNLEYTNASSGHLKQNDLDARLEWSRRHLAAYHSDEAAGTALNERLESFIRIGIVLIFLPLAELLVMPWLANHFGLFAFASSAYLVVSVVTLAMGLGAASEDLHAHRGRWALWP